MREQALIALVRSALLAEAPAGVAVLQKDNPVSVGASSTPTIYIEVVIPGLRYGVLGRRDLDTETDDMTHEETQWLETTLQISTLVTLEDDEPSASDLLQIAADILMGDKGLAAFAVQGVRPLRITTSRTVHFVNDRQQYEANPSFDIVLTRVQIRESTTPALSEITGSGAPL